jgi:hypothetical protein
MAKLSQQLSVKGIGPRQYFEALQTSGDPRSQQLGIEGLMKLDQTEKYDKFLQSQQPIPAQQAPAPMAGGLGTGTFGMDSLPGMPARSNALAPQAATPVAANPVAAIDAQIAQIRNFADPRAKDELARLEKRRDELVKTHVVGGSLMRGTGDVIGTAPITPYQIEQNKIAQGQLGVSQGQLKVSQGQLGVSQGNLANAQKRLQAEMATGNLTPETVDFIAETYRQTGALPALGMGPMAAAARSKILTRAGELAMGGGQTAAQAATDVRTNKAENAGMTAGQRAVGTQIANVQVAANEANKMIEVAKPYVTKVNPTDYPVLNAAGNYVAKNTGDPNIVGLATSLNAIVNTYARAINPKGTATVSDKNHAREILNTAMSKGQINEAFNVMNQEMNAALASGPETRAGMRAANSPAAATASLQGTGGFKYLGTEGGK